MTVFLLVLIVTTLVLYRKAKTHLDNELGARLKAVATNLAYAVGMAAPDSLSTEAIGHEFLALLHEAAEKNDLSNIVLLSPDGLTVVDLAGYSPPGEPNPFIDLDFGAVVLARSGEPAYTNLYRSGDVYLKSAYAPIISGGGEISGVVGVEAGAAFFKDLRELSNVIALILVPSFLVVAFLGLLFYRQSRVLDRAQEAIIRKENLATMGRMVANIAHDIRNPLSIINTSAERLRKKYRSEDEVFSYISEEVEQLNRILSGYLDFAASHSGEMEPRSVQAIIRRSLMILEPELEARKIDLVQVIPSEEYRVTGNDKRMQQAVLNVLLNAVQAVENGGRIEVSLFRDGARVVVRVKDNGGGIAEKDLKDVTKPFYTKKADGSGLGLSIVKSVMEEHDGEMEIKSEPGLGTEVSLLFPAEK